MLYVPKIEECKDFAIAIGAKKLIEVKIEPKSWAEPFNCHNNCELAPVLGYFFLKDSYNILHAYKHSIMDIGEYLDITPTNDNRKYNIFAFPSNYNDEILSFDGKTVFVNRAMLTQPNINLFYVYALIDPRTNIPFYIGKGKEIRYLSHFSDKQLLKEGNTKKTSKIKKLKTLGLSPIIEFYAQNIENEELAYQIEEDYIKKYGRIGFEKDGILTNICIGTNPPNFKGKNYSQIYGKEKA